MIKKILFGVLLIPEAVSALPYSAEMTLCAHNEIMVASCNLDENKNRTLSFCSDATQKIMFYRFGTASDIELEVVFSDKNPVSRWVDIATYTTFLGFRIDKYTYTLGVPEERFGAKAFLEITKNNETIMTRNCLENSFGEKKLTNTSIFEVDDSKVRNNKFIFPP